MSKESKKEIKTLESPKGTLLFAALRTPRKPGYDKDAAAVFSTRMMFLASTPGTSEFKAELKKINKDLVITEDKQGNSLVQNEGDFIVNARSNSDHPPTVYDNDGNRLLGEDIPMVESGTTANLILSTYEGKGNGKGGINLQGVVLQEVIEYVPETVSDEEKDSIAKRLAQSKK